MPDNQWIQRPRHASVRGTRGLRGTLVHAGVFILITTLLVASVAMFTSGCGKKASPQKVRLGVLKALGTVTPYLAQSLGYFKEQGLEVELISFPSGPIAMEAFASGNIDIVYAGIGPVSVWQSKGVKVKVVANANTGGHMIMVRSDSGITKPSDLKGKKIATPTTGSVTDILFRQLFLKDVAKLDPAKDMKVISNVNPADMPVVLMVNKEVDAIVTWEPYATQALQGFKGVSVLFDFGKYWREKYGRLYETNVVSASQDFIDKQPDALRRVLKAHRKATDYINNNKTEAYKMIAKELSLTEQVIAEAAKNIGFSVDIDQDQCLITVRLSYELGYVDRMPTKEQLFDLRFLK